MNSKMLSSFKIKEGVTITSNSRVYYVDKISNVDQNSAVFAQCRVQATGEIVALKCIQKKFLSRCQQEENAFHYLSCLNADENNIIKVIEIIDFHDWTCFAFEKLEISLFDFILHGKCEPLRVNEIRVIAQQMFLALNELKNAGITHTDIKAENIMLVNHESQPFKVKLTGFGVAGRTSTLSELELPKTCGYSAPEVYLDCPLDQSLDMWSLGCTLAFLFLGFPLYPTNCDYEYMRIILKLLGQPDQSLLDQGRCVNQFFTLKSGWRLKTPEEYVQETGRSIQGSRQDYDDLTSLDDLLNIAPEVKDPSEYENIKSFVDLLKKMLVVNPVDRISPADALKHSFIIMEPLLPGACLSSNVSDLIDKMEISTLTLEKGLIITHQSKVYQVEEVLGSGTSTEVAKCRKQGTNEKVAIKFFRKDEHLSAIKEVNAYNSIRKLDSNQNNLLRLIDSFIYKDCFCLVFELLDLSLYDFLKRQGGTPLRVAEIRPIAQQMLVALSALKSIGLTHTDIRPENIMLVNQESQPFRVKLIDFGAACDTSTLSKFKTIQSIPYRAPEVHLGLSHDEGIDVWGLGCTLAFLALGRPLFPKHNEYEALRVIVKLLGLPDENSLDEGWRVNCFFTHDHSRSEVSWRLKTLMEYKEEALWFTPSDPVFDDLESLDDLLKMVPNDANPTEFEEFKSFIDLLKKMLVVNPADRILPSDALKHSFIAMEPLPGACLGSNVTDLTDENEISTLTLEEGLKITHRSNVYEVEEILGSGTFGEVAKCRKQGTDEIVAIKFFRKDDRLSAIKEVNAYNAIRKLDPNKNNLLRFFDNFLYKDFFCLVFELLDISLFDFLNGQAGTPLRVAEIRPIAQQLLVALSALKSIGLTHTDIKPDNIMLVNQESQPWKVKLIDFGMVFKSSELSHYELMQAKGYRAPEVYLGLPRDESIDMWGLGCSLAFLFLSNHLFPFRNEYEVVRMIVKLFGQPDKNTLDKGLRVKHFFTLKHMGREHFWKLKTPEEYKRATGEKILDKNPFCDNLKSLDDFVKMAPDKKNHTEIDDIKAFVDLLKKMLTVNSVDRISPADALKHRFITTKHLPGAKNRPETKRH